MRDLRTERLQLQVPPAVEDLVGLSLFAGLPEKARPRVVEKARRYMHWAPFATGEHILRLGAYSDSAFFVVEGQVEVRLPEGEHPVARPRPAAPVPASSPDLGRTMAARAPSGTVLQGPQLADGGEHGRIPLGPGEIFGDMSALSRYPVSADVFAIADTRLLQIRLPGLRMLLAASRELKKTLDDRYRVRALGALLRSVGVFASLDEATLAALKAEAQLVSFEPGAIIEEEGSPAEAFYMVRGGYVKLTVRAGTSDLAVTYLRTTDSVGEAAVLRDVPWPFRLQALEHVELVRIPVKALRPVLENHPALRDALWDAALARLKTRGAVLANPVSAEHVQMAMDTGLVHGESVLLIDLTTCTQCDECVRGCADAHGGVPRFVREGQTYRKWLIPAACYQCTDPVCMIDCPTGAISRDLGTLEVTINPADHATRPCIGCGNCAKRCPWGNIFMYEPGTVRTDGKPVEVATKCDLCLDRPQGPACVQMCPHGCAVRVSFRQMDQAAELIS